MITILFIPFRLIETVVGYQPVQRYGGDDLDPPSYAPRDWRSK